MSRRHRRAAKHSGKSRRHVSGGDIGVSSGLDPGVVMVNNRTGEVLERDQVIDLEEETRLSGGANPSFSTRLADPMKAFTFPQQVHVGNLSQFGAGLGTDTAIHLGRLPREPEAFRGEALAQGSQYSADEIGAVSPEELGVRAALADHLAPLRPDQRQRALKALEEKLGHTKQSGFYDGFGTAHGVPKQPLPWKPGLAEIALLDEMMKWAAPPHKLSRVQESVYHKIVQAYRDGELMLPAYDDGQPVFPEDRFKTIAACISGLAASTGIFLLQHDWAGAFSKAVDYQGGEIKYPYHLTVFECRISERRVAMLLVEPTDNHPEPLVCLHVEIAGKWGLCGTADIDPASLKVKRQQSKLMEGCDDLADALLAQARAVFIALDAEVAQVDVIRAPYKLNQKRERAGKLPLFDYHVVSLSNRRRYAPRALEPGDQPHEHRGKRLHFVRGHYRHYTNHKVWIKWHLRGDPDLGFVDKEYRL